LILLFTFACVDPPRRPLSFPVAFQGDSSSLEIDGGTLVFEQAIASVSDLHAEGAPQTARWSFSPFAAAYAHPGHDFAGDVRAELLGVWTLDLLGGHQVLGQAEAYEGDLASARFSLAGDPAFAVRGTFTGPDGALPFDLQLPIDQLVSGLQLEGELDADAPPAELTLRADLAHALSFVTWSDTNADGSLTVDDGDTANTLLFGATSAATWAIGPASESP
jgi:hypothetical protein